MNERPKFHEPDLLDFSLELLLGHDLSLKMEEEERKLSLSAYKTSMKKITQMVVTMMGRGNFPLGGFIMAEGIILRKKMAIKRKEEALMCKRKKRV